MSDLHAAIMNLPCEPDTSNHAERLAFKRGHKQARHAAADLVSATCQGDLELAMAIIAPALQMALEMGSVELPANGVADLKRGLELYRQWQSIELRQETH